jgi:hypothetical protein
VPVDAAGNLIGLVVVSLTIKIAVLNNDVIGALQGLAGLSIVSPNVNRAVPVLVEPGTNEIFGRGGTP